MSSGEYGKKLLSVSDLCVDFAVRKETLSAIRKVSFDVYENEVLAIVGESGSGKTVLTRAISGLLAENGKITGGSITADDRHVEYGELGSLCGEFFSFVFQDPSAALNPIVKIGDQISDIIKKKTCCSAGDAREQAIELMNLVGIRESEKRYEDYPFQYSGGMLQRVVIAIAVACRPRILVCDEATTALDVTIQAQILGMLKALQKKYGFSIIIITHDFGVVAKTADRAAVMYAGEIVERGTCDEIFYDPRHPYTMELLAAMPQLQIPGEKLRYLSGAQPSLRPSGERGDAFAPRNRFCMKIDTLKEPPMFQISSTHYAKTWLLHPEAPPVEKPENIIGLHDKVMEWTCQRLKPAAIEDSVKNDGESVVSLRKLQVKYRKGKAEIEAVRGVSLELRKGEILSIVGESGSGKTTLGKSIAGIVPVTSGTIFFEGDVISAGLSKREKKNVKRKIQMIFQNQSLALNDRMTVGNIVLEGINNYSDDREENLRRAHEIIEAVGLSEEHLSRYPHELSGGQRQRLGIARSLILNPDVVIADEPVASLDVSIRSQVLELIKKFRDEYGTSFIFISHDLSVVRLISDRIAVMKDGKIVEEAETEALFLNPKNDYTKQLIDSIPMPDPISERQNMGRTYETETI